MGKPAVAAVGFGGSSRAFALALSPTPMATTPRLSPTLGSRGFYLHAYLGPLPRRAVDMLAVRIEQLTAEGLSPSKIRGPAGRS